MNLADHSSYSRNNLGDAILGRDMHDRKMIALASEALLKALWREHPRILRHLGAVKPGAAK